MEIESIQQQPLRLPADCSISGIRAVYELILKSLKLSHRVEIDCSAVDKADVTSIQLLISATRTADHQGRRVNLTAFSQSLKNTFHRAGLSSSALSDRPSSEQSES
jgi:phospholipid transport system transporter-binding protein